MESAKEFLRRLDAIATRDKIVTDDGLQTVYSTPQPGFFCESMIKLNELVIHAIACPPKIPIHMVNKLHPDVESEDVQAIKWIWGMEKIRFFDHVTTEMLKLDVSPLKAKLQKADDKAFGSWDASWLEDFSNEALVLRILYQVRPVILQNMAKNSDAYIRQAINAFEEAKLCPMGTLDDLQSIRDTANKNNGPIKGRYCGGARRPFKKPFYEGLNIQAWPMPTTGRRWRRYGPFGGEANHPVQLDPFEVLNKNKDVKKEPKEEVSTSDNNHKVDPTVTVTYQDVHNQGNYSMTCSLIAF